MTPLGGRAGEKGFSLLEALVVLAITALIALLLLPLNATGVRDLNRAKNVHDRAQHYSSGQIVRKLLQEALVRTSLKGDAPALIEGRSQAFMINAAPDPSLPCTGNAGLRAVKIGIEQDGAAVLLVCESQVARTVLSRWSAHSGAFLYSPDGVRWRPDSVGLFNPGPQGDLANANAVAAPLVALLISSASGQQRIALVAQVGAAYVERQPAMQSEASNEAS